MGPYVHKELLTPREKTGKKQRHKAPATEQIEGFSPTERPAASNGVAGDHNGPELKHVDLLAAVTKMPEALKS